MDVRTDREAISPHNQVLPHLMEGEREALEELIARCRVRLYNTAFRLLGNHEDAEDALQDGLLAAYRHLNMFEGRSQLSTWLTRIVVNAALMQRRRQHRSNRTVSIDQAAVQDDRTLGGILSDPKPNPEESYVWQEQLQRVQQVLQALPKVNRRAWWLRHVQGLTIREVATIIGISSGTLKSQLFRARRRLRRGRPVLRIPAECSITAGGMEVNDFTPNG